MRTRSLAVGLVFLVLVACPACRGCASKSDAGEHGTPLADGTRVPVDRDDKPLMVIDGPLLDRTPADFVDGDRKAWRLRSLLGSRALDDQVTIEVDDAQGQRVVLAQPIDTAEGREAIVTVNRMGELRMVLARRDDDVFAAFHGRGGNRGRGGEPGRVREVRRVRVLSGDAGR